MAKDTPEQYIYGSCYTLMVVSCFFLGKKMFFLLYFEYEELVTSGDHL